MDKLDLAAMNPDLASERRNLQFNGTALTNLLCGGEEQVKRWRVIANWAESNPELKDPIDTRFMSREARLENSARKSAVVFGSELPFHPEGLDDMIYLQRVTVPSDVASFSMHYLAALPYFQGQANEEQISKWLPQFLARSINVAYAQTELGHGSNLRQLETTAIYDPVKQEFIINSPTLTSIKWWVGNLGKSANYTIVMAQLTTQGKRRGIHAFLVPVRHPDTHKLLPGVLLGDIGPKFGMPSNDNGFAQFTNVRIPRENMLMRHAKVLEDGTYVPPAHQKLSYGGMVFLRSIMISFIGGGLQRAVTIAIRYSCVRRQGNDEQREDESGDTERQLETKLLDYQTQQYRLLPELAKAFAIHFISMHMRTMYSKVSQELHKGDVSNLALIHALSSGIKAVVTRDAALGIEICRLSCGGHGYSLASGLPELYADIVAGCTYEGDNIILLLQTARSLVKQAKSDLGTPASPRPPPPTRKDLLTLDGMIQAYHLVAKGTVRETAQILNGLKQQGNSKERAWNNCTVDLCRAAKANVRAFIVETFANVVKDQSIDPSVRRILTLLCELYAVCSIQSHSGDFMEHAGYSSSDIREVRNRCCELLAAIRPAAVQLVDAFEFRDTELRSVLGRYDGNVYEKLFEWAKESPLNQKEILDIFPKYIGPIMRKGRSKL